MGVVVLEVRVAGGGDVKGWRGIDWEEFTKESEKGEVDEVGRAFEAEWKVSTELLSWDADEEDDE